MWITHPTCGKDAGLYEFKKNIQMESVPASLLLNICADCRYRLFINGRQAAMGPCKASQDSFYYDTVEIAPYLVNGQNEILVKVLRLFAIEECNEFGTIQYTTILRRGCVGLVTDCTDERFCTDPSWEVSVCPEFKFYEQYWQLAYEYEDVNYTLFSRCFVPARRVCDGVFENIRNMFGEYSIWPMRPRPIPMLTYDRKCLAEKPQGNCFVLTPGTEVTGTVAIDFCGEKGASIVLTYAESYVKKGESGAFYKDMRDDASGEIQGPHERIVCDGTARTYETFCLRAFRYLKIETQGAVEIKAVYYYDIHYPLSAEASFTSSDPDAKALWDISVRTLQNCMHESFEDCPHYEQLQYAMDSRLEALYARQLSSDRALVRKCITDFAASRLPEGLVQARTPSARTQVIAGFSLHYILMVYDQMRYDGDSAFIKSLMPTIDGILEWFDRKAENGIVGALGPWSFVDWVPGWRAGVPDDGPLSVYNFMYVVALESAAELADFAGRSSLAAEYRRRAIIHRRAAKAFFFDQERNLFRDGTKAQFSMHGQIWAVLADAVTGTEAEELIRRTLTDATLPICSYPMMFYVFRAAEKVGLYPLAYKFFDQWRELLQKHCTTWAEDCVQGRSECHAWGSLPLYEFCSCLLGVRPDSNGYGSIAVKPHIDVTDFAAGTASTTHGNVEVAWKKENGLFTLKVVSHASVPVRVYLPDGKRCVMRGDKQTFICRPAGEGSRL